MKLLLLFVSICTSITLHAQQHLRYPVRRTYTFTGGSLALAESIDSITQKKDTLHFNIQAVCYNDKSEKLWEMNDHILDSEYETSIWFWTKFCDVKDLDGDGLVDPVIVYGSNGMNGRSDGRMKILIYYKGKKYAIRHQDSEMDEGRYTEIDASFYTLPQPIQKHIRSLMKRIYDADLTILAFDFQQQMDKKKTDIR